MNLMFFESLEAKQTARCRALQRRRTAFGDLDAPHERTAIAGSFGAIFINHHFNHPPLK
jgi:hypothetical protein